MSTYNDVIIGIDFGTTNSVVAVLENNSPRVIPNSEGSTRTPSVVSYMENGDVLVGELARRQGVIFSDRTISGSKRMMGSSLAQLEKEGIDLMPYRFDEVNGQVVIQIDNKQYTPSEVGSEIFKKLKSSAEEYLGLSISRAIITVPAYFDDCQRKDIVDAARLAGLDVVRLINEPAAAALAYGLGHAGTERIVVLDFGGGTFDMTVLEISNNVFEVKCSVGDSHLGGDDIDAEIMQWVFQKFLAEKGFALPKEPMILRRLKDASEKAKCELSIARQAMIHLPFLTLHDNVPVNFEATLMRSEFESLIRKRLKDLLVITNKGLEVVGMAPEDIDRIILVGGSMRIPLLQEMIEEYFQKPPFKGLNPDEIVAMGAATQGGVLNGKLREVVLLDVTPHSLGIEVENNLVSRVIEKNSIIPIRASKIFTTTHDDQDVVQVHVLQGEGETVSECRSLGNFVLEGIQKGRAGTARIEVTFSINASGMVEVTALDLVTREERSVGVTVSPGDSSGIDSKQLSADQRRQRAAQRVADMMPDAIPNRSQKVINRSTHMIYSNDSGEFSVNNQRQGPSQSSSSTKPSHTSTYSRVDVASTAPNVGGNAQQPVTDVATPAGTLLATSPYPKTDGDVATGKLFDSAEFSATPAEPAPPVNSEHTTSRIGKPAQYILDAMSCLQNKAVDPHSINLYTQAVPKLRAMVLATPTRELMHAAIWMSCILGQVHESGQLLSQLVENNLCPQNEDLLGLYNTHLQYFPSDVNVRAMRGYLLAKMGNAEEAMADYETVCANAVGCKPQHIKELIDLYQSQIRLNNDSAMKFKLVRLLVCQKQYDKAIELLQPLSRSVSYRERATKILALCFWQKGMHYLAWQRLQELEPTEEVKDMFYRLAVDMIGSDQLINAVAVLKNLKEIDEKYRDVASRLETLEMQLQQDQTDAGNNKAAVPDNINIDESLKNAALVGDRSSVSNNLTQNTSIMKALKGSRFTPIEEINRGSMGIVFRARDKILDELVALKILSDYLAHDPHAVERFKREARAAKRLSHPNIVRIHDMYEIGDKRLLSMEYIEGQDVKALIGKQGRLQLDQVLTILNGTCAALEYAHKMGIVHRDIKPANIMLCPSGLVKITDFGIAKFLHSSATRDNTSTQAMGTPLYMSPEQVRGDNSDARSDIYSLGTTLYEMLTGNPPFYEGNIEYHHLYSRPRPLPDDVPQALAAIVMKCLEKDPNKRYQSIPQLRQDLRNAGLSV